MYIQLLYEISNPIKTEETQTGNRVVITLNTLMSLKYNIQYIQYKYTIHARKEPHSVKPVVYPVVLFPMLSP